MTSSYHIRSFSAVTMLSFRMKNMDVRTLARHTYIHLCVYECMRPVFENYTMMTTEDNVPWRQKEVRSFEELIIPV